jgi:ribosomal-protein-alanine N-acetyltransferase
MPEFEVQIIESQQTFLSALAFELYELDLNYFPTPWTIESWETLFLNHDRSLFLLNYNKKIMGFILFEKSVADSFAHLIKILIHPDIRSKGHSKNFLNKAIFHLESLNCSNLFLEVEESNTAAQKLYLSVGFKAIHVKKHFYGTNRSAIIMTRDHS